MKPKRKRLPKPWNNPTGTVSRLPEFFRSAIKLFSTRSDSTELPRPRDTTSSQREHKLISIQQSLAAEKPRLDAPFLASVARSCGLVAAFTEQSVLPSDSSCRCPR